MGVGMVSQGLRVVSQVGEWLWNGESVWLVTVVATYGSSPRPPGSMMAWVPGKPIVGSLSGGCIEEALLAELAMASEEIPTRGGAPQERIFGETAEEQQRFALPCGGRLHLLIEHVPPSPENVKCFQALAESLIRRREVIRELDLKTGAISIATQGRPRWMPANTSVYLCRNRQRWIHSLTPVYQLLVVGAGEVAQYLTHFAQAVGFKVSLCDSREDYLQRYPLNSPGVKVYHQHPDDVVRQYYSDAYSGVIAVAHDPRVDDMALMEALQANCFFVGAMGSLITSQRRRARLQMLDIPEPRLNRLHAPLGLDIGSKTPAEIALSAVAQLVQFRSGVQTGAIDSPGIYQEPSSEALWVG